MALRVRLDHLSVLTYVAPANTSSREYVRSWHVANPHKLTLLLSVAHSPPLRKRSSVLRAHSIKPFALMRASQSEPRNARTRPLHGLALLPGRVWASLRQFRPRSQRC